MSNIRFGWTPSRGKGLPRNRNRIRGLQAMVCTTMALAMFCVFPERPSCATEEPIPTVKEVRFDPARPITGDKVKLYIHLDNAVRAELRWSVNDGEEHLTDYDGVSPYVQLDAPLKAGDTLKVDITPFTGMATSGKTVSRSVKCYNSPPVIKLVSQTLKDFTYIAKIDADDPEKGKVTLSIEGPEGMKIDQQGNISWKIKTGTQGNFPIKVTAKDEEGAEAALTYAVRIHYPRK